MEHRRRFAPARWWCPLIPVVALVTILAVSVVAQTADKQIKCKDGEECVSRERCLDGKIDTHGRAIISARSGMSENCDKLDMTCCQTANHNDSSIEEPAATATNTEDPDWSAQCGQRTVDASETEYSNNTTRFEFPWSVALFNVKKTPNWTMREFLCGGTLIDDYVVVTAARCVHQQSVDSLRVQLGPWDLNERSEPRRQEIAVERVISHPNYMPSSHVHNIALLILANAVTVGRAANRICLPDPDMSPTTAGLCYVTGWRISSLDDTLLKFPPNTLLKIPPNTLLKFRVSFYDPKDCTQRIRDATGVSGFRLPRGNICPKYSDDVPTCPRAPGSALICTSDSSNNAQQYFLVGIASHILADGCFKSKTPEVFLETSSYIRWIDKHLDEQGRELSYSRPESPDLDSSE